MLTPLGGDGSCGEAATASAPNGGDAGTHRVEAPLGQEGSRGEADIDRARNDGESATHHVEASLGGKGSRGEATTAGEAHSCGGLAVQALKLTSSWGPNALARPSPEMKSSGTGGHIMYVYVGSPSSKSMLQLSCNFRVGSI